MLYTNLNILNIITGNSDILISIHDAFQSFVRATKCKTDNIYPFYVLQHEIVKLHLKYNNKNF